MQAQVKAIGRGVRNCLGAGTHTGAGTYIDEGAGAVLLEVQVLQPWIER